MDTLTELFSTSAAQRVGWALIHFLWQGTAVALLLAVALGLLRNRSAQARWVLSCSALALMAVLPVATGLMVSVESPGRQGSAPAAGTADVIPTPPGGPAAGSVSCPPPGLARDPGAVRAMPPAARPAAPVHDGQPAAVSWPRQLRGAVQATLPWAVLAWLCGVTLMSVWHLGGWLAVRRMKGLGTRPVEPAILEVLARLLPRLRIRRPVRLLESVRVAVPLVLGWLRPVILLPVGALTGLTPQQLEAILAHELAHIRRWDSLVLALQAVMETLLFYHPAVWWVSRQIRQESERCCDDLAVGICGDRRGYAHALAKVAEFGARGPALAAGATGGKLLPRIRRLLGAERPGALSFGRCLSGVLALLTLVAIAVGVSCSSLRGPHQVDLADRPATRPEVKWGEPVGGLRCGLEAVKAEVAMGSKVDFVLHLQFDPKAADPKVDILDRTQPHVFNVVLTLTDTKTGKTFNRPAFDIGMSGPQVRVPLEGKPLDPEKLEVYLLNDAAEQIPAGTYAVTATCRVDPWPWRPDPPPEEVTRLWAGKIISGPLPLTITPVEPKAVEIKVPTSLRFLSDNGRLAWEFSEKDLAAVSLRVRPGFNLVYRLNAHLFLDDKLLGDGGSLQRGGGCESLMRPDRGTYPVSRGASNRVLAGGKLKVVADLEIIENSAPARHGWHPLGPVVHTVHLEGVATKDNTVAGLARPPEEVWGEAVNGLQTRLASTRESAELFLLLRNCSDKEKIALDGLEQFKDPWHFLHVRRDDKTDVPVRKSPAPAVEKQRLGPGHVNEISTVELAKIVDLAPGLYTLQWSIPADKVPAGKRVPPPSNVLYLKVSKGSDGRLVVIELPPPEETPATAPPATQPATETWGETVDGLQTRLTLDCPRPRAGERIYAYLDVRNVSDKPIELVWTGNLGPLLKVNRDGRNVPRSSTTDAGIYAQSKYVLQPGKQAEAWTELLTEEFDLSQPGEYSFQWGDVPAKGRVPPPSNVVTLKLAPAEAASTASAKQPKWLSGGEWSQSSGGLQTRLAVPEGTRFPAGKPILMRIELRNVGDKPVRYCDTRGYRGDAIKVADHNGKDLPFLVGRDLRQCHGPVLKPGEQVLLDGEFDLAEYYYLRKPGTYAVRYEGGDQHGDKDPCTPPSLPLKIEVIDDPAARADGDPVGKLLAGMPQDWSLWGSATIRTDLERPGRNLCRVRGGTAQLLHKTFKTFWASWRTGQGRQECVSPVIVWITREQARPEPWQGGGEAEFQQTQDPRAAPTDYLGSNRYYHVYAFAPKSAVDVWPTVLDDLRKMLQVSIAPPATQPAEAKPQATDAAPVPPIVWRPDRTARCNFTEKEVTGIYLTGYEKSKPLSVPARFWPDFIKAILLARTFDSTGLPLEIRQGKGVLVALAGGKQVYFVGEGEIWLCAEGANSPAEVRCEAMGKAVEAARPSAVPAGPDKLARLQGECEDLADFLEHFQPKIADKWGVFGISVDRRPINSSDSAIKSYFGIELRHNDAMGVIDGRPPKDMMLTISSQRMELDDRGLLQWRGRRIHVWGGGKDWPDFKDDILTSFKAADNPAAKAEPTLLSGKLRDVANLLEHLEPKIPRELARFEIRYEQLVLPREPRNMGFKFLLYNPGRIPVDGTLGGLVPKVLHFQIVGKDFQADDSFPELAKWRGQRVLLPWEYDSKDWSGWRKQLTEALEASETVPPPAQPAAQPAAEPNAAKESAREPDKQITELIRQLGAEKEEVRAKAYEELMRSAMGDKGMTLVPALESAIDARNDEKVYRFMAVLTQVGSSHPQVVPHLLGRINPREPLKAGRLLDVVQDIVQPQGSRGSYCLKAKEGDLSEEEIVRATAIWLKQYQNQHPTKSSATKPAEAVEPATQPAFDWNRVWERVLAACAGMEKDHPSVAAFRVGARADQGNKEMAAWKYESNVEIDYDRGMACKRKNPAGPYYYVRLSIHPIRTGGPEVAPANPSIAWDGKSSQREYGIRWLNTGIGVTVLSDDAGFVKAINAILDREITRTLKESSPPATQPAAGELDVLLRALGEKLAGTWTITVDKSGDWPSPYGWQGGKGVHLELHYKPTPAPGERGRRTPELWIMERDNSPWPHNDWSAWSPARQIGVWRGRHVFAAPFGWREPSEEYSRLVADIQAVIKATAAPPATQPGKAEPAAERAKQLKGNLDKFRLAIWHCPEDGKEHRNLTLSVAADPPAPLCPFHGSAQPRDRDRAKTVRISREEAAKIIDHLATEGFLNASKNAFDMPKEPCGFPGAALVVDGPEKMALVGEIGWRLPMLKRLDALRKVLDGDAAKAMDELLAHLEPRRKQWEKEAASPPAGQPSAQPVKPENSEVDRHIERLRSSDWRECRSAAEALGEIGPVGENVVVALVQALRDEDRFNLGAKQSTGISHALRKMGPTAIPHLVEAMKRGEKDHVRWQAAELLGACGPQAQAAVPVLTGVLEDENDPPWVRAQAARALVLVAPTGEGVIPALLKALGDKDFGLQQAAARGLGSIGPKAKAAIPQLRKVFGASSGEIRWEAASALGRIGPVGTVLPDLSQGLKDADPRNRACAASALERIGPAAVEAVPALIEALGDGDRHVRFSAAMALGQIGAPTVPHLTKALKNQNWEKRVGAAKALDKIGPAAVEAVPALTSALEDKERFVRTWAAKALGSIGSSASPAEAGLRKALADEDPGVRRDAENALKRIRAAKGAAEPAATDFQGAAPPATQPGDTPADRAKTVAWLVQSLDAKPSDAPAMWAAIQEASKLVGSRPAGADMAEFQPLVAPLFRHANQGGIGDQYWRMAADVLVRIGQPALPLLAEKLKSDDSHDRWSAMDILGRIGEPKQLVISSARSLLADRDEYAQRTAIETLGRLGKEAKDAVKDLEALVHGQNKFNQVCVQLALIRIQGPGDARIKAIASYLKSQDKESTAESTARYAAEVLADLGAPARIALPELLEALDSAGVNARIGAAFAIGRLRAADDKAIAALIDRLKNDTELEVRRTAASALGDIGPQAAAAIPALREALSKGRANEGWWVAENAIRRISTPPATQPGKAEPAAERAKELKGNIGKFRLAIWYCPEDGKEHRNLTMSVAADPPAPLCPFHGSAQPRDRDRAKTVRISREEAAKITDHLATQGFLDASRNIYNIPTEPCGFPAVVLEVEGPEKTKLRESIGWRLPMLKRLDALRKVLDGDAAKAMDQLLGQFEPQRKQWETGAENRGERVELVLDLWPADRAHSSDGEPHLKIAVMNLGEQVLSSDRCMSILM